MDSRNLKSNSRSFIILDKKSCFMTDSKFLKICGIGSILAVVAYVGTVIFSMVAGLTKPGDLAGYGAYITDWFNNLPKCP